MKDSHNFCSSTCRCFETLVVHSWLFVAIQLYWNFRLCCFYFFPNFALRNRGCGLSMDAAYTRMFTVTFSFDWVFWDSLLACRFLFVFDFQRKQFLDWQMFLRSLNRVSASLEDSVVHLCTLRRCFGRCTTFASRRGTGHGFFARFPSFLGFLFFSTFSYVIRFLPVFAIASFSFLYLPLSCITISSSS